MLELKEIVKAIKTAGLVQVALNKVSVAFRDNGIRGRARSVSSGQDAQRHRRP